MPLPTETGVPDAASSPATLRTRQAGAHLFELRRWIHPVLLTVAVLLDHPVPVAMAAGGVLLAVYLLIRVWCCRYIRGAARVHARKAQERKVLVTGGPFGLVRNPLYVANTLGIAGACLLFGPPWFGAVAAGATLLWYHFVVRWEESVLAGLYGEDYATYKGMVPRFVPRLARPEGLPRPDTREIYPWARVLRRERGAIGLVVLVVALAIARSVWL